ncbi:SirB2 family protein [Paraglaciecola aquimarina]|uniref:SirB2 family protein n=1 Tax=Paraglaciecola aquimarina TaxID=1235557 RepID=A0ABU3SZW4_9ALTE|nr:SirB2 family protein [Paraglaciecola aquimarina]MDU0355548.1 SirB2 family protein [Paraglaciecola aquimarina]
MYTFVKHLHLTAIALSVILFLLRFLLLSLKSPMLQKKWLKILPHVVDTLLLLSAATLCVLLQQYPFVDAWVTEKLFALVMYVFMVILALKLAQTTLMRIVGFVGALSWVAFAGMVAVSKTPLLFG